MVVILIGRRELDSDLIRTGGRRGGGRVRRPRTGCRTGRQHTTVSTSSLRALAPLLLARLTWSCSLVAKVSGGCRLALLLRRFGLVVSFVGGGGGAETHDGKGDVHEERRRGCGRESVGAGGTGRTGASRVNGHSVEQASRPEAQCRRRRRTRVAHRGRHSTPPHLSPLAARSHSLDGELCQRDKHELVDRRAVSGSPTAMARP